MSNKRNDKLSEKEVSQVGKALSRIDKALNKCDLTVTQISTTTTTTTPGIQATLSKREVKGRPEERKRTMAKRGNHVRTRAENNSRKRVHF